MGNSSIGILSAKIVANPSGFVAGVETAQVSAEKLSASLQMQIRQLQMGDEEFARYQLRLAGVNDATVKLLISQKNELNALQATGAAATAMSGSSNRATYAVQQLAFGAQDAATVFGTTGMAGAVRASSNNVIQFASLLHPLAGTIAAIAGTGIALWADNSARADKEQKALNDSLEHTAKLMKIINEAAEFQAKAAGQHRKLEEPKTLGEAQANTQGARDRAAANRDELQAIKDAEEKKQQVIRNIQGRYQAEEDAVMRERKQQAGKVDPRTGAPVDTSGYGQKRLDEAKAQRDKEMEAIETDAKEVGEKKRKIERDQAQLDKELAQASAAERRAWEKKEQEDRIKRLEQMARDGDRAREAARKKEEDDQKKYADEQAKALHNRERLRHQSQAMTPEGKRQNAIDEAQKRLQEIKDAGFEDDEAKRLKEMTLKGLESELKAMHGKKSQLAGSAAFGSTEAYSRLAEAGTKENGLSEAEKKTIEALRRQEAIQQNIDQHIQAPKFNVLQVA